MNPDQTTPHEEILGNWRRQLAAMDAADTDALRACFTPDAVLVHMTGCVQPLDEWMRGIRDGEFVYHEVIEKSVEVVELDGTSARLVGDLITGHRSDGSGQAWPLHAQQRFVQADDAWRCAESRVTFDA